VKINLCIASISLYLCLLLISCGGGSGEVSFLSLKKSQSDSYSIVALDSTQEYVLIPFSADSYSNGIQPSGSVNYTLKFTQTRSTEKLENDLSKNIDQTNSIQYTKEWKHRMERKIAHDKKLHAQTTDILKKLSKGLKTKPKDFLKSTYKKDISTLTGSFKSINTNHDLSPTISIYSPFDEDENDLPDNTLITGILRAQGSNSAIYVDERDNSSVGDAVIESLAQTFEEITLKRNRSFWGEESDVNGDGIVTIFLSNYLGSGIVGFFRPLDLLPQDSVNVLVGSEYKTNEREIIFSQYPHGPYYKELIDATLAHEFYHLINFAIKTLKPMNSNGTLVQEELWLNEGMAHLTEDITGHGFDAFPTAGYYLEEISNVSVAGSVADNLKSGFGDDTLERRGATMLLLRYMFEQKGGARYSSSNSGDVSGGGANFLKNLNRSSYSGINNLERTYGTTFEGLFRKWIAAVSIDGTGLSSDGQFNYQEEQKDPFTKQNRGFNLRGTRILPTGTKVTLKGPTLLDVFSSDTGFDDFTASVYESGSNFFKVIIPASTGLNFTISGAEGRGLGMTIVKIR